MLMPVPDFEIPEEGMYLWKWFYELNTSIDRINFNGYYDLIPPSEFLAWSKLTKNLITPLEYDILKSMDAIFCKNLNADIYAKREKEEEKRKLEMQAARSRSRTAARRR